MAVTIRWLDQKEAIENCVKVPTVAGLLFIYHIGDVITKTEWSLEKVAIPSIVGNGQSKQIKDYLNNPTIPLSVNLQKQGSNFRNKVWAEICKIPAGQVLSYSELAGKVGSGARAVANACRDNPFPGIIPCHRVVSVSGLGGYMGQTSGKFLGIKEKLLAIESE